MSVRRLERGSWIGQAALVGVAAFFGAQGLSAVASIAIGRGGPPLAHAGTLAAAPPLPPVRPLDAEPILARNAFDSVTGSLLPKAPAFESAPAADDDFANAPPCAKVRAVVIAAFDDPETSVAAFEVDGSEAVLRRQGGEIGAAKVEYIGIDRVFVREAGKLCQTQLFAPAALVAAAQAHTEATPHVEGAPGGLDPKLAQGIVKDSPGHYRIERSVVEKLLDDQSSIMKGGVIHPEKDGDKTVGVRLSGVRPDQLFGVLGLADGDVIRSLNGYDFTSPERMLEAYARLRTATELRLDFTRGGQATTNQYAIQ